MIRQIFTAAMLFFLMIPSTRAAAPPATEPESLEHIYLQQTSIIGGTSVFSRSVLTITLPRKDLWVQADMGDIPTEAGLASTFYFFRCSCGKDRVVGQFVLADYEVNDVIDALRAGRIDVISVGAMFSGDKPRMMEIRFQGEGQAEGLARTLKSALDCVGDARSARQPSTNGHP